MKYRFCGRSGLQLPLVSLGMWHNFGDTDRYATMKEIAFKAFSEGITHFDLADNIRAVDNMKFASDELQEIDNILNNE